MQPSSEIRGIIPVVPTPFDRDEELDLTSLRGLIDFAVQSGCPAACLPAYGSEFYKLSEAERPALIETAVRHAAGRIRIVAQSNHPSSKIAADIARRNECLGADVISIALPRQFSLGEEDQLRYAIRVVRAVTLPVLVQDFNPGGPSVGAAFSKRLKDAAPNFCYLKLEEPLMGLKVTQIREATADSVAVLEGWGGMHLLELVPAGIRGAIPGLAMCDLFQQLYLNLTCGEPAAAEHLFRHMLPQIVYSLQNMELFHHCEKRLLVARGLLRDAVVRDAGLSLDSSADAYINLLNRQVLDAASEFKASK
ncbi:MAG TPA: dihydrodipicolinate synthase family protein [Bryobacteraceae bacterium]|nr:dihydrodipicolinate synthase family protein [Bryobacteraceae bacterium]